MNEKKEFSQKFIPPGIRCPECGFVGEENEKGECPQCGVCQGCYENPCTCIVEEDDNWHEVEIKTSIRTLIRWIKNNHMPPSDITMNGKPAKSKEEALQWLQECIDRGITAI